MLKLNIFTYSGIFVAILSFILIFIILKCSRSKVSKIWTLFNLAVSVWALGTIAIGVSRTPNQGILSWRFAHIGVIFIPIFFYHVTYEFCKLRKIFILRFAYLQGLFFFILNFTDLFISKVNFLFNSLYYLKSSGLFYPAFFMIWVFLIVLGQAELFRYYRVAQPLEKNQIKYFLVANYTGFIGGGTNFLPMFNIIFYPYGNFAIPIYSVIVSYAIIKYRLMDINLALTRTGIFILVYSVVLGIPFAMAFWLQEMLIALFGKNWWMVPLVSSTALATIGPFIYLYIQRRAEDRLLREQRRYQTTLRQASIGMTRIKDLNKLLNLIVHIVTRTVRLKHGSIFLLNERTNQYELKAIRDKKRLKSTFSFDSNSSLVWNLILEKEPLVYEEIKQRSQDYKDEKLATLEQEMRMIDAAVVVPSFVGEKLLGFLVLGEKASGKSYVQDDINVFSVLANQSALAIENAQFYEDIKETQTQLFQAEKMATIGTMADGLSHQINNRFHALGMIAADTLDILNSIKQDSTLEDIHNILSQVRHALERVKENVKQGGEVVHGLLKYSRAGAEGFEPVDLDGLINSSLEMAQYKVKITQFDLFRDYQKDEIPKIKGNFTQLQEVFFNLIDNAYDAIVQRGDELKEPNYRGNITIMASKKDSSIEIIFQDNGIGVRQEDREKIFTPFFTTKTSSRKGTGLGLYVIQKIITNHNGKIKCSSEYKTGTMFTIELPIARK